MAIILKTFGFTVIEPQLSNTNNNHYTIKLTKTKYTTSMLVMGNDKQTLVYDVWQPIVRRRQSRVIYVDLQKNMIDLNIVNIKPNTSD